jgi:DNA invertase Pin-like site-specific DNA recombinase
MKVAFYARVSTNDKDQDPETQLYALREFSRMQGWTVYKEYVDLARANDLRGRKEWRALLDDAAKRRFQAVIVFKLDRAFRSVKHLHDTLTVWELSDVDFKSVREGFDTGTAIGRLLLNLLASLAEFELETISERVRAGMNRARAQGKHVGRPALFARRPALESQWGRIRPQIESGTLGIRAAAREMKVTAPTILRLLQNQGAKDTPRDGV